MKKPRIASVKKPGAEDAVAAAEGRKPVPSAEPEKKAARSKPGVSLNDRLGGGPKVWWQKTEEFFREVKVELKKVAWPSRKEVLASTSVVLVLCLLAAAYLGIIDLALSRLIRAVIG